MNKHNLQLSNPVKSLLSKSWLELSEAEQQVLLEKVRAIASGIEDGRQSEVAQLVDELTGIRESHLFKKLGRLTRQLHEVLTSLERDTALARLADTQIPAAKERLNYVMAKSEEATHQTLTAIEETVPIVNALGARTEEMRQSCVRFSVSGILGDELQLHLGEILAYFDTVRDETKKISQNLTTVLLAQEAQDLTGQVIRRVIELVQELESQLVGFVASCGDYSTTVPPPIPTDTRKLEGPQIKPTQGNPAVVSNQDEVDDLLSSLGF